MHASTGDGGIRGIGQAVARALHAGSRIITISSIATGPGQIPAGRVGQPDDVAGTVAFLASPVVAYINGPGHPRQRRLVVRKLRTR